MSFIVFPGGLLLLFDDNARWLILMAWFFYCHLDSKKAGKCSIQRKWAAKICLVLSD